MPVAVTAIVILLALGVGLLAMGVNTRISAIRTASDITARCAADSGLAMALFEMNQKLQNKPWIEGTLPSDEDVALLNCDATTSYQVTGDLGSGYTIQSLGFSGNANRSVTVSIRVMSAFEHAILTLNNLTLKSGTTVDGYNSSDPTDTDLEVSIGSMATANDSVVLNNGAIIDGGVFVGGGSDMDTAIKDLGATTDGKFTTAPVPLPPVTAPTLTNKGSISVTGVTTTITSADSGQYSSINLNSQGPTKPAILEVSGGGNVALHITGDIGLGNTAEIYVRDGTTLTMYVDGDIVCAMGSSISREGSPQEPASILLYATGEGTQNFDLKAKSAWTGVIYAPNTNIDLYAGADAYGAIVANSFEFKQGGNFHYDKALSTMTADDEAVVFIVNRWSEGKASSFD